MSGDWGGADTFILVYVVAPLVGALAAGLLYFQILIAARREGRGGAEPVG